MRRSCSSSPPGASSKWTGVRGRRKRDEPARESRKDRKRRVRERVVGGAEVDDEAIVGRRASQRGLPCSLPRRPAQLSRGPADSDARLLTQRSEFKAGIACRFRHSAADSAPAASHARVSAHAERTHRVSDTLLTVKPCQSLHSSSPPLPLRDFLFLFRALMACPRASWRVGDTVIGG